MTHHLAETIAIIGILLMLGATTACRTDTTEPTPVMIAPGQTTIPLDAFTLRAPPPDGESSACGSNDGNFHPCPPDMVTLCDLARNATSIAIVELIEQTGHIHTSLDSCAKPYGNNEVFIARVQVLAVAAGRELPAELRVVFLNFDWALRQKGPLLIKLIQLEGEWFGVHTATVMRDGEQLSPTAPESDIAVVYELPGNFTDLATETMDAMDHPEQRCPEYGPPATEEELIHFYKHFYCGDSDSEPVGDDAGIEADAR